MKFQLLALPVIAASLAACGPAEPTRDRQDVLAFDDAVADLRSAPRTAVSDLPQTSTFGQVRYEGELGANIEIDGREGFALLGDMQMDVGFAGSRDVDGVVDNVNLLRNGTPIETLGGDLDISGQQASGKIDAVAEGVLTRVRDMGVEERTNLTLDLDGTIRSDRFDGDSVVGVVNEDRSFGDGFGLNGPTFNVILDGNGAFYGQD